MGNEYIINGTEEVVDAFTANSGIVVPAGQTITNNGSYAGTPVVTSITAGSGISVTNPTSPGAATVGFLSAGTLLGTFTTGTAPFGVAIDQSGNVWVTNNDSNTLEKFNSAGTLLGTFTTGTNPFGVAIDQSGNVWVTNYGSNTLEKFNSAGTLLGTFTTGTNPLGVAIDQSGNVWVTNYGSATLEKFNSAGTLLGTFTTGTAPFGVAIDQSGNTWVANYSGNTLEKFNSAGTSLGTFATGTNPLGVAIDQSGNVWVTNNSSNTLEVFAGGEPYGVICPLVLEYSALSYSNLNMAFLPAQSAVTTTSTSLVSTGLGVLFTPLKTGTVIIEVSAFGNNGTLADGIQVGVGYTAGSALVALGTAMGAQANGYTEAIAAVAGDNSNLSFTAYIQGLQSGTEYAIQPTFASITGGTSTLTITSMIVEEK